MENKNEDFNGIKGMMVAVTLLVSVIALFSNIFMLRMPVNNDSGNEAATVAEEEITTASEEEENGGDREEETTSGEEKSTGEDAEESTEENTEESRMVIGTSVVQVEELDVKNSPNGNVIATLVKNDEVEVWSNQSDNYEVRLEDGRYGYIYGAYTDLYDMNNELIAEADAEAEEEPAEPNILKPEKLSQMSDAQLADYVISQCVTADMDVVEKIVAVDKWLCANVTYDLEHFTTKDCIAKGRARCQGYANAFACILNRMGIKTEFVIGISYEGTPYEGSHAWNRTLIGDSYYYTDVTWNDVGSRSSRKYLLISKAQMDKEHTEEYVLQNGYNYQ